MNGRSARRGNTAKAPAPREPMKPKKRTLAEECQERLDTIREDKWAKRLAAANDAHDAEADEVMAMMYGPNWRTRTDLPE